MSTKTIKRGGRTRPMGIIGAAISTALVPFGLIAAQKSVQKKPPFWLAYLYWG